MTPEDYRRAGDLFNQLRGLGEGERAAALDSSCAGNAALRARVVRLLKADREAAGGSFLGQPAIEDAARFLLPCSPQLPAIGAMIGNYRLGPRVGAGGMGIVFEGQDVRLHRRVAIKLLPMPFAVEGTESIRRFQREGRAVCLLNHPNIVSIFDADFDEGHYYIAMEFIEGKTLRQLIASASRLDAKTILDLIGQTASALSAAHEAGIVHRDIKPENIMVRPDGFVKVLDFGLAKLLAPSINQENGQSDLLTDLRTQPGNLAGTIQYLSPEQVAGKPVSPRSDLFSLGVVAYELATGIRPFDGPTHGAIFDAILNGVPKRPSLIRTGLDSELDGLILRSLEKDPELRFQTAADLKSSCKRLTRDSSPSNAGPKSIKRPLRYKLWMAAAAVAIALVGYTWYLFGSRPPEPSEQMEITRITRSGIASYSAISPDGRYVAYVSGEQGDTSIRLRELAAGAEIEVLRSGRAAIPSLAFSSDGDHIYFVRIQGRPEDNGLFQIPMLGGDPKRISEAPNREFGLSHNGRFAVFRRVGKDGVRQDLTILNLVTGEPRVLSTRLNAEYFGGTPSWSSDDRYTAVGVCTGNPCGLAVIDVASGAVRKIGPQEYNSAGGVAWLPGQRQLAVLMAGPAPGYQLFLVDYPSGRTRRITNDLNSYRGISLSADGGTLATDVQQLAANIWIADWRAGQVGQPVQVSFGRDGVFDGAFGLDWANDHEIAYTTNDSEGWNLQVLKLGGTSRPLTTGHGYNAEGIVCPDGRTVVFESDRLGQFNLWKTDRVTGRIERLTNGPEIDEWPSCTPESRSVIFSSHRGGQSGIWRVGFDGSAPVKISHLQALAPTLSPDGKWIACLNEIREASPRLMLLDSGTGTVASTLPFPAEGHMQGSFLRWTPDSSGILYSFRRAGTSNLWLQSRAGGAARQLTNFPSGIVWNFAFSRDGRRLALARGNDTSDVVLIRRFRGTSRSLGIE